MEFPDLLQTKENLMDVFSYEEEISSDDVKVIASPYRICPLGAHIDHQGGPVLGMTINACTLMAFHPRDDSFIKLRSENYPGKVKFDLRDISESTGSFWGIYPRAAALALQFFNETQRVQAGLAAWDKGLIEEFGHLMSASCKSSIEQYECGVQAIYDLQQIVKAADGVLGSRFMGGGFGGCVVGFVKPSHAAVAVADIQAAYRKLHPEVADQVAVYLARSDDGVRFL